MFSGLPNRPSSKSSYLVLLVPKWWPVAPRGSVMALWKRLQNE